MRVRVGSFVSCALAAWSLAARPAHAVTIDWKGYTWSVTDGGMAGVAAGSPANVSVDSNGYLHLQIRKNGNAWTAAEMFTTTRLGFGTYQWQIDGAIDAFDKNVVLGLFPYGPAANIGADGTNEIDIEYSRWGQDNGPNGDWTNYPASGSTVGELSYTFSLNGGTLSTSRFIWSSSAIEDFLLSEFEPPSSTNSLVKTWKYSPANPKTNIPQQPLPLGMNLWCYAIPSDGKNVEVIVRDFQFLAEGTSSGGSNSGGSAGATASGGATVSSGGTSASGGATASSGGTSASGGATVSSGGTSASGSAGSANAGTASPSNDGGDGSSEPAPGGAAGRPLPGSGESSGCSCSVVGRSARSPFEREVGPLLFVLLLLPATRRFRSGTSRCLKTSQRTN